MNWVNYRLLIYRILMYLESPVCAVAEGAGSFSAVHAGAFLYVTGSA